MTGCLAEFNRGHPPLNLPHFPQVLEDAAGGGAVLEVAGADELAERAGAVLAPIAEHLRAAHGELARRAAAAAHAPRPALFAGP